MPNLTIMSAKVNTLDNLYSLNDLHKASGGQDKHAPYRFVRNDQTKELVFEIQKSVGSPDLVIKTFKGGNMQGTYACEELMLSYAMWISPKFHLVVLRAFLLRKRQVKSKHIMLPGQDKVFNISLTDDELRSIAMLWKVAERMRNMLNVVYKPLNKLGATIAPNICSAVTEYQRTIERARRVIARETEVIKPDKINSEKWNSVIPELRKGELRQLF